MVLFATAGLLCSFLLTKEHVQAVEDVVNEGGREKISFAKGIKYFVGNKYFLFALFVVLTMNMVNNLNSGSQTYFYTYAMKDPLLVTKLNLVTLVPTILSVLFLATPCISKFGKKKSVYLGAAGQIISYAMRGIAAMTGSFWLLVAGTILGALATGPIAIPINILTADAVDYGECLTNKRIEGIGSAVVSFSQKLTSGLAAELVGWILQLTGYVANEVQSAATINGITALFAWGPMILLVVIVVAYVLVYRYDVEEKEILSELDARKQQS